LGGNRKGEWYTYANLFSVFLIGGLWHGASWMFVIWGALHGIAIVLHRMWKQLGLTMNTMLAWFITFNFINITWIFFRAKNWEQAKNIFLGMGGMQGVVLPEKYVQYFGKFHTTLIEFGSVYEHINGRPQTTAYIIMGFLMVLMLKNSMFLVDTFKPTRLHLAFSIVLFLTAISMMSRVSEFLYFNF